MALVNAAHRSLVRLARKQVRKNSAVHVSLSVFTCQTAWLPETASATDLVGGEAQRSLEAQ